jgi:4-hydroxyphenylpyruvate dioxygenase-like putative hemolysin
VLRWHREGYYPVAAQIRTMLPRFRHLSDPEILSAPFKLSDAQELVARSQDGCAEPYAMECTEALVDHRALRSIGTMGGEWPTRMSPNISKPNR